MSLTNEDHIREARQYQKCTELTFEIHNRIINIFYDVYKKEQCYDNSMVYNFPALKDTIESILHENYRTVVYDAEIELDGVKVEVQLNFVYDRCVRSFTLFEHDFTYMAELQNSPNFLED